MGVYDDWKQPQLQAEASKRGLSAGGTNAEIAARLDEWDAAHPDDDLLNDDSAGADANAADLTPPAAPAAAPGTPVTAPPPAAEPASTPAAPAKPAKSYVTSFPCHGELSTGMHNEYREQAYARALAAGLTPRGGLAGVSRIDFRNIDGARHAVYEVVLQRQAPARP